MSSVLVGVVVGLFGGLLGGVVVLVRRVVVLERERARLLWVIDALDDELNGAERWGVDGEDGDGALGVAELLAMPNHLDFERTFYLN